jgi:Zn-dependent M32 family carboxypeptidase
MKILLFLTKILREEFGDTREVSTESILKTIKQVKVNFIRIDIHDITYSISTIISY